MAQSVRWVPSHSGHVPKLAVAAGQEGAETTFIGRFSMHEEKCVGRVVPSERTCYAISKAMEHKRTIYDVLVRDNDVRLAWVADYDGHVPDTAIAFNEADDECNVGKESSAGKTSKAWYVGRAKVNNDVVPGVLVPGHGAVHVGHDMRELIRSEYEVLCVNSASSLRFLAAKAIRDALKRRQQVHRARRCLRKMSQIILALERKLLLLVGKEPRSPLCESWERRLELPRSLVSELLTSPRVAEDITPQLDFNTIMANCCAPEEHCCCQMWVEVTLQGLY